MRPSLLVIARVTTRLEPSSDNSTSSTAIPAAGLPLWVSSTWVDSRPCTLSRSSDAVQMFSPYTHVQEVNGEVRAGLREIVDVAMVDGVPAFIFVNNRLEGNSPGTIIAITE